MMESINICPICLRNDRQLKAIPTALSEYHYKITDNTLAFKNCYCSDCECLLRKTYNFQQKCTIASKVLKKWMNTKNKTPTNMLHLKLPPISLGVWTKNSRVFNVTYADSSEEPMVFIKSKIEPEDSFELELTHEHYQTEGVSDVSLQNFNNAEKKFTVGTGDSTSVVQNELLHVDTKDGTIMKSENIFKFENNKLTKIENKIIDDVTKQMNNTSSASKVEVQSKAEKSYIEINIDGIVNHTNNSINHMPNETYNNVPNVADAMTKLNENVSRLMNVPNKQTSINYTEDKDLELIYPTDNGNKNNDIIVIDDESEDASLNSNDDCDDYLHSPPRKTMKKNLTLDELANIDLSDEDLDEDYKSNINKTTDESSKKEISMNKFISTERSITSKLEIMDKSLDLICENWEVTSLLIDKGIADQQKKEGIKNMIHTFLTERKILHPSKLKGVKDVITHVEHINTDLDLIIENCANTVEEYKSGMSGFKERLKATLEKWEQLITDDGAVIDKNTIIDRLDTIKDDTIKRLLNLMHGKKRLSPDAVKILRNIQKKNFYAQYESVFDIELLTTEKDRLEEFERRKTYECYVTAMFKCEICYQGFKTEKYLENHKELYHDESQGQFSCHICHVRHKIKRNMRSHLLSHNVVFKCKQCPLVTYYKYSMINHYEQHKGTIYTCGKCANTFKSRSMLLSHQSSAHPTSNHICTVCGGAYYTKSGLSLHMRKKHQGESSQRADGTGFSCEECNLTFPSERARFRHREITHAHKKIDRRRGPRKEPNVKKTCRVCNVSRIGGGWIKPHYQKMHPDVSVQFQFENRKSLLCDICGAVYYSQIALRSHMRWHSDDRPFACELCPKQFRAVHNLNNHRLYHFPPALVCKYCGKKFHTRSNLYSHVRGHERTVPTHKCQYCQKGFFAGHALNAHIRGVHHHIKRIRKSGRTDGDTKGTGGKRSVNTVARRRRNIASTDESSTDD